MDESSIEIRRSGTTQLTGEPSGVASRTPAAVSLALSRHTSVGGLSPVLSPVRCGMQRVMSLPALSRPRIALVYAARWALSVVLSLVSPVPSAPAHPCASCRPCRTAASKPLRQSARELVRGRQHLRVVGAEELKPLVPEGAHPRRRGPSGRRVRSLMIFVLVLVALMAA